MGTGSGYPANHICSVSRKVGTPKQQVHKVRSVIIASAREHSRKPDEAYPDRHCRKLTELMQLSSVEEQGAHNALVAGSIPAAATNVI